MKMIGYCGHALGNNFDHSQNWFGKKLTCAYVINFYNYHNKPVFCKVGSTGNMNKRFKDICDKEYLKRPNHDKVRKVEVVEVYPTTDRYGAYTIENMLHTHFLKQGCEKSGNDYFLNTAGNREDLANDFPLHFMAILLSPNVDHKPLYASIKRLLTSMKYI